MNVSAHKDENDKLFLRILDEALEESIDLRSDKTLTSGNVLIISDGISWERKAQPPYTVFLLPLQEELLPLFLKEYLENRNVSYLKLLRSLVQSYQNSMLFFLLHDAQYNPLVLDFIDFLQNQLKIPVEIIVYVCNLNKNRKLYMELMRRRCRCVTARVKRIQQPPTVSSPSSKTDENLFHFKPFLSEPGEDKREKPWNKKGLSSSGGSSLAETETYPPLPLGELGPPASNPSKMVLPETKRTEKSIPTFAGNSQAWPAIHQSVLKKRISALPLAKKEEKNSLPPGQNLEQTIKISEEMPASEGKPPKKAEGSFGPSPSTTPIIPPLPTSPSAKFFPPEKETWQQDFPDLDAILLLDKLGLMWEAVVELLKRYCPEISLEECISNALRKLKAELYSQNASPFYEKILEKLAHQILEKTVSPSDQKDGFIVRMDYPEWAENPSRIADILLRFFAFLLLNLKSKLKPEIRIILANQVLYLLDRYLKTYSLSCLHNPQKQCQAKSLYQYFLTHSLPTEEMKKNDFPCCGFSANKKGS